MSLKLGIDVGGTFTDFVVAEEGKPPRIHKTLSTPSDPSIAVVEGLTQIAASMQPPRTLEEFARSIDTIVHGTTVTTNATLTSTGARCGLLTTEGVRDALEMRRGVREEQYNNRYVNVRPLVPRERRVSVSGRIDRDGRELTPVNLDAVREALAHWRRDGVQAIAVCFMNSFANPAHEQAVAELVRKEWPEAYLSVSSEVLPSIRFYPRISTTALNAYVGPKLGHYLDQLVDRLNVAGFRGLLLIMQSNGGVISPQAAREKAALTLLSGPAGGPGAGLFYVAAHGQNRCVTTDMGGTSFEASVAVGSPMLKSDGEIARHKIALPMLDIHTIGAGGGSIGWLDNGGMLRMGPQSAGADPGPACYGRGGRLPTTTDANLVLGYLDPDYFAGGRMKLDIAAAHAAIEEHIAKPMGLTVEQAAAGMYRVACNNMAQGVREVTIKRGFDPREFPLIPGGGAGPIHGCLICNELEIPLQIVPRESSVLCAFGMLMCDLRHDYVRTFVARLEALDWSRLNAVVGAMADDGSRLLSEDPSSVLSCGSTAGTSSSITRFLCRCRLMSSNGATPMRLPAPSMTSISVCTDIRWKSSAARSKSSMCGSRPWEPPGALPIAANGQAKPTLVTRSRAAVVSTSQSVTISPRCRYMTDTPCPAGITLRARHLSSNKLPPFSSARHSTARWMNSVPSCSMRRDART